MSKNPLRRLSEQVLLTSMRPPLTERQQARGYINVAGKRILMTGASSGIGESAAEKFAAKGATVIAVARRQELLD
nr:SDR family NAD(P)-dependent oxidoreductase [Streptomyces sp. DSM 41633]